MNNLSISFLNSRSVSVLTLSGDFTSNQISNSKKSILNHIREAQSHIVVNLQNVENLDSEAIEVIDHANDVAFRVGVNLSLRVTRGGLVEQMITNNNLDQIVQVDSIAA